MEENKLTTLEEPIVEPKATYRDYFNQVPVEIGTTKIPMPLYFYFIDNDIINKNGILVPPTDSVLSVVYTPYLERGFLTLLNVNYDYTRFPIKGLSDAGANVEAMARGTELQRLQSITYQFIDRELNSFAPYKITGKAVGGTRKWQNEGKLWQYPYHYSVLFDGISEPLEVRPHLCYNKTTAKVKVKTPLTPTGQYTLYVEQYKEDLKGVFEGQTSSSSLQLPIVSSAYTDYMSRNKAQMTAGMVSAGAGIVSGAATGAAAGSVIPGLGTAAGAIAGAATGAVSGLLSMNQSLSQQRDLKQAPGTLKTLGSDLMFDLQNNLAIERNSLNLYRVKTVEEYLERIGDYFAMYGYAQNKVMRPNVRNRYYYNFIKTANVNISCKNNVGIPKEHFEKLKVIFNNGTTIWHIDRENCHVGDYSMDNYEL